MGEPAINERRADAHVIVYGDARPCECVFKKPRKGQRGQRWQPQCDCDALPGEGHALHCARVWGEQEAA